MGAAFRDNARNALLELSAVLRAAHQGRHAQLDDPLAAQHLRVFAGCGAQRDRLGHRRFADARSAHQHGIVFLRAPRQGLDNLQEFVAAANDRPQLLLARGLRQVTTEPVQKRCSGFSLPSGLRFGRAGEARKGCFSSRSRVFWASVFRSAPFSWSMQQPTESRSSRTGTAGLVQGVYKRSEYVAWIAL